MKNLFNFTAKMCDELDHLFNEILFMLIAHAKTLISDAIDKLESRK